MPIGGAFEREPLSRRARIIWTVVTLLTFGVLGIGALYIINLSRVETITETRNEPAVETLEITANGMVSIRGTARDDFQILTESRGGLIRPAFRTEVADGVMNLDFNCTGFFADLLDCVGGLELEVPHGTNVVVHGRAAQVRVADIAGDVTLNTTLGRVDGVRTSGTLTMTATDGTARVWSGQGPSVVTTDNGPIIIRGSSGDVTATSSAGAFFAEGVRGNVDVTTVSGDIFVRTSGDPVALNTDGVSGRVSIQAPVADTAEQQITARSAAGGFLLAGPDLDLTDVCPVC